MKRSIPRNKQRSLISIYFLKDPYCLNCSTYGILQIQLETGRYKGDDRINRLCRICNGVIEDQHHFVFECPAYSIRRGIFIEHVKDNVENWDSHSNTEKFIELFDNQP